MGPHGVGLALLRVQFPHVNGRVKSRRNKAGVVWQPADGSNGARVSLEHVLGWVLGRVEVEHMDEVYEHASEEMPTV